jgi:hypothetical protein
VNTGTVTVVFGPNKIPVSCKPDENGVIDTTSHEFQRALRKELETVAPLWRKSEESKALLPLDLQEGRE